MFLKLTNLVVIVFALGTTCLVHSQAPYTTWNNGIDKGSWDIGLENHDAEKMLALWDSIGNDLLTERNSLAGTYFKGGYDAGYFLRWSINKGFVLIPYFDENLIFHAGLGQYNEFNGQCCEFAPNFLCKKIDTQGNQASYPVPAQYAHFIKNPIEGTITFVGKERRVKNWGYQGKLYGQWMERAILIPVRVDLRGDHRARKNMLFRLVGEPTFAQYLQIVSVGTRTSPGYVVRDVAFGGKETYRDTPEGEEKPLPPIRVGTKVTTKPTVD